MDETPGNQPGPDGAVATKARHEPLQVAQFTDNYGPGHSGLLYAVHFLEGELLKAGHKVLLVAPRCSGPNPYAGDPRRREVRLPSVYVPGINVNVARGQDFELQLDRLAANPPDVIHVQGLGPIGLLGVWAAKRYNIPLLVTWHTDFVAYAEHYWHLTPFLDAAYRLLKVRTVGENRCVELMREFRPRKPERGASQRNLIKLAAAMLEDADLVTTPSKKTADRVRELAPTANVRAIPNGADALPSGRTIHRTSDPRILYIGRIAVEKNIELLLDAFEIVRYYVPNAQLVLVGDWKNSGSLRGRLSRLRRKPGYQLVGQVPREQLGPWYESGDLYVFPSLTDTQALVLHEAAHAGLPIVTVDAALNLVVEPGVNAHVAQPTASSLAAGIMSMLRKLEDPEFKAKAHARSKELAGQWTIARQARELIAIYENLADHRPA